LKERAEKVKQKSHKQASKGTPDRVSQFNQGVETPEKMRGRGGGTKYVVGDVKTTLGLGATEHGSRMCEGAVEKCSGGTPLLIADSDTGAYTLEEQL